MTSSDKADERVKIACYGIVGLLLGGYLSFFHVDAGPVIDLSCTLSIAALFTFLARRYGEAFLERFRDLVRFLLP